MKIVIMLTTLFQTYLCYGQLTLDKENNEAPVDQGLYTEPKTKVVPKAKEKVTDQVIYHDDKDIPNDYPVSPQIWGIGAGLSLADVLSPKPLKSETSPGFGFQAWGRYQFNEHLGSQFGLHQNDFTGSSFGITSVRYSALFQTGWMEGYNPYVGLGLSLNNVNRSDYYQKDYTQFGWQLSVGAHIPCQKLGKRAFWIPQVDYLQVFEKNNDAKSISGLAFVISLGYFFDAEDFEKNVSLINGK